MAANILNRLKVMWPLNLLQDAGILHRVTQAGRNKRPAAVIRGNTWVPPRNTK